MSQESTEDEYSQGNIQSPQNSKIKQHFGDERCVNTGGGDAAGRDINVTNIFIGTDLSDSLHSETAQQLLQKLIKQVSTVSSPSNSCVLHPKATNDGDAIVQPQGFHQLQQLINRLAEDTNLPESTRKKLKERWKHLILEIGKHSNIGTEIQILSDSDNGTSFTESNVRHKKSKPKAELSIDNISQLQPSGIEKDDYAQLRNFLENQQWREADEETWRLMLAISNCQEVFDLSFKLIEQFPCEPLRIINMLWKSNSKNRFGFSIQKEIWKRIGGRKDENTDKLLKIKLGWSLGNITYNIKSPKGHLPYHYDFMSEKILYILSRVDTCEF